MDLRDQDLAIARQLQAVADRRLASARSDHRETHPGWTGPVVELPASPTPPCVVLCDRSTWSVVGLESPGAALAAALGADVRPGGTALTPVVVIGGVTPEVGTDLQPELIDGLWVAESPPAPPVPPPCGDGLLCITVYGCGGFSGGVGFTIEIRNGAGMVVATATSGYSYEGPTCFTLASGDTYTVTVSKPPRWQSQTYTIPISCRRGAWRINRDILMSPAPGYCCPCFGYGCTEPVKLPLTLNDGLGDVVLSSGLGTSGECGGGTACADRPATGSIDCCKIYRDPYTGIYLPTVLGPITTAMGFWFSLIGCDQSAPFSGVLLWCLAQVQLPTGLTVREVPTQSSCGDEPCSYAQISDPFDGCTSSAIPVGPGEVTCSPFTYTQTFSIAGCLALVYGDTVTYTITEAP